MSYTAHRAVDCLGNTPYHIGILIGYPGSSSWFVVLAVWSFLVVARRSHRSHLGPHCPSPPYFLSSWQGIPLLRKRHVDQKRVDWYCGNAAMNSTVLNCYSRASSHQSRWKLWQKCLGLFVWLFEDELTVYNSFQQNYISYPNQSLSKACVTDINY